MRTRTPFPRVARFGQHLLAVATVGAVLTGCGAASPDILSESDISALTSTTAAPTSTTSLTPTPTPEATDTPDAQISAQQPFVASPRTKAAPRGTTVKALPPTVPQQAAAVVQAPATRNSTSPSSTSTPIERHLYDNCSHECADEDADDNDNDHDNSGRATDRDRVRELLGGASCGRGPHLRRRPRMGPEVRPRRRRHRLRVVALIRTGYAPDSGTTAGVGPGLSRYEHCDGRGSDRGRHVPAAGRAADLRAARTPGAAAQADGAGGARRGGRDGWRAAGGGQPGYSRKLDPDRDGIACR